MGTRHPALRVIDRLQDIETTRMLQSHAFWIEQINNETARSGLTKWALLGGLSTTIWLIIEQAPSASSNIRTYLLATVAFISVRQIILWLWHAFQSRGSTDTSNSRLTGSRISDWPTCIFNACLFALTAYVCKNETGQAPIHFQLLSSTTFSILAIVSAISATARLSTRKNGTTKIPLILTRCIQIGVGIPTLTIITIQITSYLTTQISTLTASDARLTLLLTGATALIGALADTASKHERLKNLIPITIDLNDQRINIWRSQDEPDTLKINRRDIYLSGMTEGIIEEGNAINDLLDIIYSSIDQLNKGLTNNKIWHTPGYNNDLQQLLAKTTRLASDANAMINTHNYILENSLHQIRNATFPFQNTQTIDTMAQQIADFADHIRRRGSKAQLQLKQITLAMESLPNPHSGTKDADLTA